MKIEKHDTVEYEDLLYLVSDVNKYETLIMKKYDTPFKPTTVSDKFPTIDVLCVPNDKLKLIEKAKYRNVIFVFDDYIRVSNLINDNINSEYIIEEFRSNKFLIHNTTTIETLLQENNINLDTVITIRMAANSLVESVNFNNFKNLEYVTIQKDVMVFGSTHAHISLY